MVLHVIGSRCPLDTELVLLVLYPLVQAHPRWTIHYNNSNNHFKLSGHLPFCLGHPLIIICFSAISTGSLDVSLVRETHSSLLAFKNTFVNLDVKTLTCWFI